MSTFTGLPPFVLKSKLCSSMLSNPHLLHSHSLAIKHEVKLWKHPRPSCNLRSAGFATTHFRPLHPQSMVRFPLFSNALSPTTTLRRLRQLVTAKLTPR